MISQSYSTVSFKPTAMYRSKQPCSAQRRIACMNSKSDKKSEKLPFSRGIKRTSSSSRRETTVYRRSNLRSPRLTLTCHFRKHQVSKSQLSKSWPKSACRLASSLLRISSTICADHEVTTIIKAVNLAKISSSYWRRVLCFSRRSHGCQKISALIRCEDPKSKCQTISQLSTHRLDIRAINHFNN